MNGVVGAATALAGLFAAVLGIFKYFNYRSKRDQKAAVGEAFGAVVSGLGDSDGVERLASALLLRRFFSGTSEYAKPGMPYADDAIGVIAATLRDEPTGNVQKVLADGLAFVETADDWHARRRFRGRTATQSLRHRDLQRANFRNAYLSLEGPAGHRRREGGAPRTPPPPDQPCPPPRPEDVAAIHPKSAVRYRLVWRSVRPGQTAPPNDKSGPRLDLSGSDFFRSDLSHASLRNDVCVGTVFYECVAVNTVFRQADLRKANFSGADVRNADFREAVLTNANFPGADVRNADFREAVLTEADFSGAKLTGVDFGRAIMCRTRFRDAIDLPEELAARMGDDGRVTMEPGTAIGLKAANSDAGAVHVFLSVASMSASSQRPIVDLVTGVLRDEGFEVVRARRDDYRHDRHLVAVRQAMAMCSGVIVVGLPQLLVENGVWRQGTEDERTIAREHLHTPWNDIETGLGIGLGLPVLAIRAGCGRYGVFDLPSDDVGFLSVDLTERWATDVLVEGIRRWARVVQHR